MTKVSIDLNGRTVTADVEDRTLLVAFIREVAGLTGTHVGCDTSQCGACVVLVDGLAVKSCTMLAAQADGASVLTIEGLANGDELHPVQAAFRAHHGLQCGFCTPGMIMTAVDMIAHHSGPLDEATIRRASRATSAGAPATTTSSRRSRRPPPRWPAWRTRPNRRAPARQHQSGGYVMAVEGIGARVLRKEDKRFVTGRGRYTDDIVPKDTTYAIFVRSPHAHARIRGIDASEALAMPGVIAVLTGADLAADKIGGLICGWMIHSKDGTPMRAGAHPAIAADTVRYVGDAVAW